MNGNEQSVRHRCRLSPPLLSLASSLPFSSLSYSLSLLSTSSPSSLPSLPPRRTCLRSSLKTTTSVYSRPAANFTIFLRGKPARL
jgi:hypothetical protein